MQAAASKPPLGLAIDVSLGQANDLGLDQILALAMAFGMESKRLARVPSITTNRNNLNTAAFLDLLARFFGGEQAGDFVVNKIPLPIGMSSEGKASAEVAPMLAAALNKTGADGKPVYARGIRKFNDTADAVALIRNALSTQVDQNGAIVLCGSPVNLLALGLLPDGKQWIKSKARVLTIAGGRFAADASGKSPVDATIKADIAGFRRLLTDWQAPIVMVGREVGEAVPFPAASFGRDFAWVPNHPVVDAYKATSTVPPTAIPASAMAAVLSTVQPDQKFFTLSEPGTITILDDGSTRFTVSTNGRHRYLIANPSEKDRVIQTYTQFAGAQPPVPQRRGGPPKQEGKQVPTPAKGAPAEGPGKAAVKLLIATIAASLMVGIPGHLTGQAQTDFDQTVLPILTGTCAQCHNAKVSSGGLNVAALSSVDSLSKNRGAWEHIVKRVRAGEMPPPGIARPSAAQLNAMTTFVQTTFDRADASTKPDPGRITAHRLNRNEYSNTIRDLLGIPFRAEKYFPTDDSGEGFDNIGEILTVSPLLMQRYMAAAERIASWALSTEIPPKSISTQYHTKDKNIRRMDASTVQADHRVDFAGDYIVRIGLPGERVADANGAVAAPVTLALWMDGNLLKSMQVETKPSGLVYFDPYSEEEMKLYLPAGDHVFRAAFVDDPFPKSLDSKDFYNKRKNKYLESITFVGPTASPIEKDSRKKILICDANSGRACVEQILSTLASKAYRRPATRGELESLLHFVDLAKGDGQSTEQGLQLAIQAILVSPNFLFKIERDPDPRNASAVHDVSQYELASRLSYFLWSSMPDDELTKLAASGRLKDPAVLSAQADRMLQDSRASAFAANFAGQWLETRNLDFVSPDPDKFKDWSPELRDAMKSETTLFFEYVLRENRPVSDFLNANYTFLNERLAKHYGIEGVAGNDFRRVDLQTDRRGGVLSQAGVLTVSSYPSRTSPVIRGKYVLQNILGTPPPPPPPDVPPLDAAGVGELRSIREQLELHRSNAICASCHSKMDPLGFGLENYDAIGKWRDMDGKFPVDSSGNLPDGKKFTTAGEMRAILNSQLPQFSHTLAEKMLTYALGRGLKPYDRVTVDKINDAVAADGYHFRTMVHQIAVSLPFQARRGEEVSALNTTEGK